MANEITPDQINAIGNLLFFLFALVSLPAAWTFAEKRGRNPWLWMVVALFISWLAVLLLALLPSRGMLAQTADSAVKQDPAVKDEELERIQAETALRTLMRK